MITFYMCQITGKYFEDTLIAKTAVRVMDYPEEPSWGLYKTYDGLAVLVDSDVREAREAVDNDS
jgi:hypothetical protein